MTKTRPYEIRSGTRSTVQYCTAKCDSDPDSALSQLASERLVDREIELVEMTVHHGLEMFEVDDGFDGGEVLRAILIWMHGDALASA